jgi:hypothetical protein
MDEVSFIKMNYDANVVETFRNKWKIRVFIILYQI